MQIIKKLLLFLILSLQISYAYGVFTYKVKKSLESYNVDYINKNHYVLSTNTYKFYRDNKELNLHMWCIKVDKIDCTPYNYDIEASIVGYNIINKEESLENPVGFEIQAEDLGKYINVCVAIPTDANHIYFTDDEMTLEDMDKSSYVVLEVRQICY